MGNDDRPDAQGGEVEPTPPALPGPAPTIYTEADLGDGADALRSALCRDFAAHHAPYRQYDGWADDTMLAIVTKRISRGSTVLADRGDAILVKPRVRGAGTVAAWIPRRSPGGVAVDPRDVRVVNSGDESTERGLGSPGSAGGWASDPAGTRGYAY